MRVVNAGSVGAPFAPPAGAHWLLLGPGIELRHTPYDLDETARQMRATGYPLVETASVRYVLDPPPESENAGGLRAGRRLILPLQSRHSQEDRG